MGFRVVQRGSAPLVLGYLIHPDRDAALREALPGLAIVMSVEAPTHKVADLTAAAKLAGLEDASEVALIGYSQGCSTVRTLLRLGVKPVAVLTIDGTHANWPKPLAWQLDVWRDVAERARQRQTLWVATCTQQTYTEQLTMQRDKHDPFMASVHVLEAVLDVPLPPGVELHEGDLHVLSFDSARIDGEAHIRQSTKVLPEMVREYLAPFLLGDIAPETDPTLPSPPSWRDTSLTLGERSTILAVREHQAGVKEEPPGSNTSPRIREYLAPAHRDGKLLHLEKAEWCAAFACWCALTALGPYTDRGTADRNDDEVMPHAYRVSGIEIEEDAKRNGSWWPKGSGYVPRRGDLAIYKRGAETWQRHVARVLDAPRDGVPTFTTIGGNEEHAIRITPRRMDDQTLLGFVEYPTFTVAPARDVA